MYLSLAVLTLVGLVCFLAGIFYRENLKRGTKNDPHANSSQKEDFSENSKQLISLINSLNDIIFEFTEDKICLNVWYNNRSEQLIDPKIAIGKKLADIIGPEKAKKFDDALDYVVAHKKQASVEYISDFGTGEWLIAKITPVYDHKGNYTSRISASLTNISEQKKYEQALRDNEILLLEAQSIAKTGNWWYDHHTKETYWSDNLYTVLEIDAIPGDTNKLDYYISLVHPDDRENARQYISCVPGFSNNPFEHKLITPTGKLKYIKVLKGNLPSANNTHPHRVSGVIQDITESKLAEKAIKISRAELIEAQTIAKIGNWKWDTDSKTLAWSDEIAHILEIDQLTTGEYGVIKLLLKYIDKHEKFILRHFFKSVTLISNYSYVFRIIAPGGKIKYLRIIVGKLMKREDGSARKIIGTLQDITERKEAEIAYKITENKYKLVLETIKLAAISLDRSGLIIFCNPYLANLLGFDQQEILGKKWLDFIPANSPNIISDWYASNSIQVQHINPVICRNGEHRIISWQNTASYDENGKIKEYTSIGEDITDQQKATQELISAKEVAEKASEFKSEFLSIMSHEIRTPMNAVIGITNLLMSEDPKAEQVEYLNILKFSAENLLAIINDILDYNKIEAGKLELNIAKFNIFQLVQKIQKSFYPKAAEKLLEIELILDKTIPESIMGDQMRLSQILNNLVSNAVKFTQKGKIIIQLNNRFVNDKQVGIKFTVTDTGIGISAENLRRIFDPFMQETHFINSNSGGTGLGLAITKRLLEIHQSDIRVLSELGQGTQFIFSISFDLAEPISQGEQLTVINEAPMLNLYGMNILLVDDNKMNLLIASKFLKKWQANVDEANDGQIAVDMVKDKMYDLIIMDLQMPVMDGFEATTIIKKTHPKIPVIALTANAMPETYNKALESGMSDYLTKPFVPGMFFEKVSHFYKPAV
jgi:two-component system sensor histidine kinase/response regulator